MRRRSGGFSFQDFRGFLEGFLRISRNFLGFLRISKVFPGFGGFLGSPKGFLEVSKVFQGF